MGSGGGLEGVGTYRRRTSSMMRFWLVEGCVVACSPAEDVVVMFAFG